MTIDNSESVRERIVDDVMARSGLASADAD